MDFASLIGDGTDLTALQMGGRAVIVFSITLLLIRLSGRRSFGQHNAFDACLTVLLGAVLSRAVVGASPFFATILAATMLVLMHRVIAWACVRWGEIDLLVSGDTRDLIVEGVKQTDTMKKALISDRDLEEAVRKKCGDADMERVESAVLERDGQVSIRAASQRRVRHDE
jgi:uncharacterized membrane protein YcaP (DUF421 family)